jgi:hypothetical protein
VQSVLTAVLARSLFPFELAQILNRKFSATPLCPHSDRAFPAWYSHGIAAVRGGFLLVWCAIGMRLLSMRARTALQVAHERVPVLVAFSIVSMGTISVTFPLAFDASLGVCVDALGVASLATMWGEWIACVPLLVFAAVTVVEQPALTSSDWFVVASFSLCIVAGFAIVPAQSFASAVAWLALACFAFLPCLDLPFYHSRRSHVHRLCESLFGASEPVRLAPAAGSGEAAAATAAADVSDVSVDHHGNALPASVLAERRAKQRAICMHLVVTLPVFPAVYMLALFGVIDAPATILAHQVRTDFCGSAPISGLFM